MSEFEGQKQGARQLRRLETLTDVIYALAIFRLFLYFPQPDAGDQSFESLVAFLDAQRSVLAAVLIGVILTIIHWLRSNAAYGLLARTDNRHSTLAILQLVSVLIFLYAVRLGMDFEGDRLAMVLESGAAALMGFVGLAASAYAARGRKLLRDDTEQEKAKKLSHMFLIEPVTATLAIGTAFLGDVVWALSWFVLGPVVAIVVRKLWK